MSGIYIHIPFCKQACHYCDFHFSTSIKKKEDMILALTKEIRLRKEEFKADIVETIYFGGGTPSLLQIKDLQLLISEIYIHYTIAPQPEITLEANPDDLNEALITELYNTKINRLSIGVQSFFEEDLQLMNRAHNSVEAKKCLEIATRYFENISVDLIYGIPGLTHQKWLQNIQTLLDLNIPHISSYALTVEPKTALASLIKNKKIPTPDDSIAHEHFLTLVDLLEKKGFIHYELSNFGKPNYFSKNNSAYWLGKKYIGIGPSAHSYDGKNRSWNISNNSLYIKALTENQLPNEIETLTQNDRYNEYIMTGLRTIWGVSLKKIKNDFGELYLSYLLKNSEKHLKEETLTISSIPDNSQNDTIESKVLHTTPKGKFFCDGIASDLFYLEKTNLF